MATAVKENLHDVTGEAPRQEAGMDIGTVLGVVSGVALVAIAIVQGGAPELFLDLPSILIVGGGMMATTFIAFPSKKIMGMIPVIVQAFKPDIHQAADYIDQILSLVSKYRTGGMKKLETEEEFLDNRFLKDGISMVVDGFNNREINELMERQINSLQERHNYGQKILRFMSVQAPCFGMVGTLIGLIQMLTHLSDPTKLGPDLAVALITTFYGILVANLIIIPIVAKLSTRTENEVMLIKAIRLGVMGINEKLNPLKIQRSMNSLLPPEMQR